MSDKEFTPAGIKNFWLIDLLVVVIFLSTAAISVYLFRADLLRTLESRDEEPAGKIIIRNNIVQRRFADRMLWERLFVDSPVYSGDLIRAADLSDATIHLNENKINLMENTLIRIQKSHDGSGSFHVDLREGNLSVTTSPATGIILNIMGRQVQAGPGTVLNAEMGEEGMIVRVSEGTASFVEEGQSRELTGGTMIVQDVTGAELKVAAAVVTRPLSSARYLKSSAAPLPVDFVWRRINLNADEMLRLEIASDRSFSRDLRAVDGLDSNVRVNFNSGSWFWRLLYGTALLGTGELVVADAVGPELVSPAKNSVFRYTAELPQLRFQWTETPGASRYVLEVCDTPDFLQPEISRQLTSASFIQSELGEGTWYWRVLPVFSSAYEGSPEYSAAAYFQIEKTAAPSVPAFDLSGTVTAPPPVPVVQTPPVLAPPPPVTQAPPAIVPPPPAPARQPQTPSAAEPAPVRESRPQPPVQTQAQVPPAAVSAPKRYVVRSGDTLSRIAAREYGNAALWRRIFDANNIADQDLIYIDQVLIIP